MRWLGVVSVAEAVTVVVLFTNRATAHNEAVTSLIGPVHGCFYLLTIACALLAPMHRIAKVLAVVPAIGGLFALSYAVRHPAAGLDRRPGKLARAMSHAAAVSPATRSGDADREPPGTPGQADPR
jgi:hypothetical protein